MKKSIAALALCFSMLLGCVLLAACGTPSEPETTDTAPASAAVVTTAEQETETQKPVPQREIINCGGDVFTIVGQSEEGNGWTGIPDDIYQEGDTGEILGSAVFARNQAIEEQFNVKIALRLEKKPATVVATAAKSGDDIYGLVVLAGSAFNAYVEEGYAYELNALGLDTSSPWYDQYVCETLTIKNKLYCVISDMTYMDKLATVATFFNKKMVEDYKVPDLFQLTADGGWTLDKMLEYGKLAAADVDNDGQRTLKDVYALSGQNDSVYYLLHAMGTSFAYIDNTDTIQCNLFDELFQDRMQRVYDIMLDPTIFINRQTAATKMDTPVVAANFAAGQAMFLMRPIQTMYDLRANTAEFGIIPSPKENEAQEKYYSSVNFYAAGLTIVPSMVKDTDRSLAILEYMAADSHDRVVPVLYNVVLESKLAPDPNTVTALDIIFENRVFDIGLIWNFGGFRPTFVSAGLTNVSSTLAALKKPVEAAIRDMDERFKD